MQRNSANAQPYVIQMLQTAHFAPGTRTAESGDCRNGERRFFLSATLGAKTKREVAQFNSHFDARVARRPPAGKNAAAWSGKGAKGWAKHSTRFAHRIAIKYLYLYLHFKSALARPPVPASSRVIVGHARRARISGFLVVDYKSLFPLIARPRARGEQSSRAADRRKNTRIFTIWRIYE